MHLLKFPSLLLPFLLKQVSSSSTLVPAITTTLNFSDLEAPNPTTLPNSYAHLSLGNFSVFDPAAASLAHLITPFDKNCAGGSPPNALLGSRNLLYIRKQVEGDDNSVPGAPAIEIANATYMHEEEGLEAWFGLVGMVIKPLASPEGEGETRILVRGWAWEHEDNERADRIDEEGVKEDTDVLNWFVDFPSEYHLPFAATMPKTWRKLKRVEVWAEYGVDKLDWEFCIGELVVEFTSVTKENARRKKERQGRVSGPNDYDQVVLEDIL